MVEELKLEAIKELAECQLNSDMFHNLNSKTCGYITVTEEHKLEDIRELAEYAAQF